MEERIVALEKKVEDLEAMKKILVEQINKLMDAHKELDVKFETKLQAGGTQREIK
jgi:cell division protein FtsB